jgi:hypothetical protein
MTFTSFSLRYVFFSFILFTLLIDLFIYYLGHFTAPPPDFDPDHTFLTPTTCSKLGLDASLVPAQVLMSILVGILVGNLTCKFESPVPTG